MIKFLLFFGISIYVQAQDQAQKAGTRICQEKKGIYIFQDGKEACFDPSRGIVNHGNSPALHHPWDPDRKDFDLLTNKGVSFYQGHGPKEPGLFKELQVLTVCNYTDKTFAVHWSSMDVLNPPKKVDASITPGKCKSNGTHMFALYPDIKKAKPFWRESQLPPTKPTIQRNKSEAVK